MAINYKDCDAAASKMGDNGYCAPLALAVAAQVPFKKAHHVCRAHGRKTGRGTDIQIIRAALKDMGFVTKQVAINEKYRFSLFTWFTGDNITKLEEEFPTVKTATSCTKLPKDKLFLVLVRGHIFTVKGGEVQDWTEGRKHKVILVMEIEKQHKPTGKNAKRKAKRYGK